MPRKGRGRHLPDSKQIGLTSLHRTFGHVIEALTVRNLGKGNTSLGQDRFRVVEVGRGVGAVQEVAVGLQLEIKIKSIQ